MTGLPIAVADIRFAEEAEAGNNTARIQGRSRGSKSSESGGWVIEEDERAVNFSLCSAAAISVKCCKHHSEVPSTTRASSRKLDTSHSIWALQFRRCCKLTYQLPINSNRLEGVLRQEARPAHPLLLPVVVVSFTASICLIWQSSVSVRETFDCPMLTQLAVIDYCLQDWLQTIRFPCRRNCCTCELTGGKRNRGCRGDADRYCVFTLELCVDYWIAAGRIEYVARAPTAWTRSPTDANASAAWADSRVLSFESLCPSIRLTNKSKLLARIEIFSSKTKLIIRKPPTIILLCFDFTCKIKA